MAKKTKTSKPASKKRTPKKDVLKDNKEDENKLFWVGIFTVNY